MGASVLVMGATFKEDVSDIRNSKVIDVIKELESFGVAVDIIDPHADSKELNHEYGIKLTDKLKDKYDAVIVAVNHSEYVEKDMSFFEKLMPEKGLLVDVKGVFRKRRGNSYLEYWSL